MEHKPLFGDLIAAHEGLAEELKAVDVAADNHFLLAGGSFPLPLYILQDYNFVLIIHAT